MSCVCLSGEVCLPVVSKLRGLKDETVAGSYERAQATLPVVAELQENLDQVIYSVGLSGVLMMARLQNQEIPSVNRLQQYYSNFKERLISDPSFMREVIDTLPEIVARYETINFTFILADKEFLSLLVR